MKFILKLITKIFIITLIVSSLFFIVYYLCERNSLTYYNYQNRSIFYQMMRKKDKFDFIMTAKKELKNIEGIINEYEEDKDLEFRIFLTEEKIRLVEEIQKTQLKIYCKEGGIKLKERPKEYKLFEKQFPELVSKFKDYGTVLEYESIDYLKIFNNDKQKMEKKISSDFLEDYNIGKSHIVQLKKIQEVLGAEYYGLTVSRLYQEFLKEKIEEGSKRVEKERRLLSIHDGIEDLFYDNNKIGYISTINDNNKLICSLKFENFNLEDSYELKDCIFELKNNKKEYPYYSCITDKWIYLIYPGISSCYYPLFLEKYYNSQFLPSLDYLHPNQKKYVLIQCKKDFYKEFDTFYYFFEDDIINKIMIFYQDE